MALEFAAAGGHHLAMIGPPGAGKTMLATRLPGVLPPLDDEQALEVTAVHSVAGTLDDDAPLVTRPPFVDPHHSASLAAIVGGGSAQIRPGSVSLAHRGMLLPGRGRRSSNRLSWMRFGSRWRVAAVLLARASGAVRYPARFQLIMAANPCPCAAAKDVDCTLCGRGAAAVSGPVVGAVDGPGRHSGRSGRAGPGDV